MGARTRRSGRAVWLPVCLTVFTLAIAAGGALPASAAPGGASGASGASGTKGPKVVHLQLKSHEAFTTTGVVLKVGDTVAVTTSGTIVFGGGLSDARSPVGVAWGKDCNAVFKQTAARDRPWPAPGLRSAAASAAGWPG